MKTRVHIVRCEDYDLKKVRAAVAACFEPFGGIQGLVRPGERILLKPNLLGQHPPESQINTHPSVVQALAELIRSAGGEALVGDSPATKDPTRAAETAGFLQAAEQSGATWAPFVNPIPTPGKLGQFHHLELARTALDASAIFNLPKLKTHALTHLTGAVKNMFGCVVGKRKAQWHLRAGQDVDRFARLLVEIHETVRPRFCLVDGIIGMEGNGPSSGVPKPIGLLIAGTDGVAVDAVIARLVGLDPASIPTTRVAKALGVGVSDPSEIEIVGCPLDEVRTRLEMPYKQRFGFLRYRLVRRWLERLFVPRPAIDPQRCRLCGACVEICPTGALTIENSRLILNSRSCISCFCCQENCPEGAIRVRETWLGRSLLK